MGPSAKDLVIISRTLSELAEFLAPRQESAGRGRVILDRRLNERRQAARGARPDRRRVDRRQLPVHSTEALLRVLGFAVVSPDGARSPVASRSGEPPAPPSARRAPRTAVQARPRGGRA
jgi:hypothetical protein